MNINISINIDDRIVNSFKKLLTKKAVVSVLAVIFFASGVLLYAAVTKPHTFQSGDLIKAEEINANFDAAFAGINANTDRTNVVYGSYYSGDYGALPALPSDGSSPFKFKINGLGANIDTSKVFVHATGWKTSLVGALLTPLQITWSINYSAPDYYVELTISDNLGNAYNPIHIAWNGNLIKLQFYACYAETVTEVNNIMP